VFATLAHKLPGCGKPKFRPKSTEDDTRERLVKRIFGDYTILEDNVKYICLNKTIRKYKLFNRTELADLLAEAGRDFTSLEEEYKIDASARLKIEVIDTHPVTLFL